MIGVGVGITTLAIQGISLAPIVDGITAVVTPALAALTTLDPPEDGLPLSATDTANYSSTAGSIVSAVAAWNVDETVAQTASTVVTVSITVTDSASAVRVFGPYSRSVGAVAVAATATPPLIPVTADDVAGDALPAVYLDTGNYSADLGVSITAATAALTLDGSPILSGGALTAGQSLDAVITVDYLSALGNAAAATLNVDAITVGAGASVAPSNTVAPVVSGTPRVGAAAELHHGNVDRDGADRLCLPMAAGRRDNRRRDLCHLYRRSGGRPCQPHLASLPPPMRAGPSVRHPMLCRSPMPRPRRARPSARRRSLRTPACRRSPWHLPTSGRR